MITCLSALLILLGTALFAPLLGISGVILLSLLLVIFVVLGTCLLGPLTAIYLYFRSWWSDVYTCCCIPLEQYVGLFTKIIFFSFQLVLPGSRRPTGTDFKLDLIRPKMFLKKFDIDYALSLAVPPNSEDEFTGNGTSCLDRLVERFQANLNILPMDQNFQMFAFGEDPVEFVMSKLGNIFPEVYQKWPDKQSDTALARFCRVGLAAGRVESILHDERDGGKPRVKYFVVRTSAMGRLEVLDGYARYGSDCYFDSNWNVVKIEDRGYGKPAADNMDFDYDCFTTFKPGEPGWNQAKFRFRSSVLTLVTMIDHLYGIHLQISNLLVVAMREQLSADHPVRRFLTPYTYRTIGINDNARTVLTAPRTLAARTFAFSEKGTSLAWAAAPTLIQGGAEVLEAPGNAFDVLHRSVNRKLYINEYLRGERGIDTPYYRWNERYWDVTHKFVTEYMKQYYGGDLKNLAKDQQVIAMIRQYLRNMEITSSSTALAMIQQSKSLPTEAVAILCVDIITSYILLVTSGHEQVGDVSPYAQDASWCASKFVPGASVGTKDAALHAALLISLTSTPMPLLMKPFEDDPDPSPWEPWTHLFPDQNTTWEGYSGPVGHGPEGEGSDTDSYMNPKSSPVTVFDDYQKDLQALSREINAYNETSELPVYCFDPRHLETSVSV
jgi:hydroperoxy icosatetraenoate dehydratase/isomerase